MNQEAINLTKVAIKYYEDEKLKLKGKIIRLLGEVEVAEYELSKASNIKHSLDAALEKLEEADEKEGRERDPAREEIREKDSTMEEIIKEEEGDLPEQTDEEKDKATLEKADKLIKRETEKLKTEKKDWKKCSQCNRRPIAPWNTKGICSTCQRRKKTNRPYVRKNVVI